MGSSPFFPSSWNFDTQEFSSQERTILVDIFSSGDSPRPSVIMLHGADGLNFRREAFDRYAGFLAGKGYSVFLVHYFDGSGVTMPDRTAMRENFLGWANVISDAIRFVSSRPDVLADRIGLLGFSLGGSLALSVAATRPGVAAVVEYFGGMPRITEAVLESMPPTLIIHGALDPIVPVEEAYRLERLLKERNSVYEIRVFSDEGHSFSEKAGVEAALATLAFFDKHLAPPAEEERPEAEPSVAADELPSEPGDESDADEAVDDDSVAP